MKVLFLAAEVAPFATVGGLSQVMYFLPRQLNKQGHDVRIFMPKYGSIDNSSDRRAKKWKLKNEISNLRVPLDANQSYYKLSHAQDALVCNIKFFPKTSNNEHTYFLENREYYELRANQYGYKDDHDRFALLSKGALEWLLFMEKNFKKSNKRYWMPDVIHCNDWHTGYFIDLARRSLRYKQIFAKIPIVFTVHNFLYQGNYDFRYGNHKTPDTGVSPLAPILSPKLLKQNSLLRGLLYADVVNTVSQTYSIEIQSPQYGAGLEEVLKNIKGKLVGILNGLDTREFNPKTDPIIHKKYNLKNFIKARQENKLDLQRLFALEQNGHAPLLAISGRLTQQKGWDILLKVLPYLFSIRKDVQLIVLGTGDDLYRDQIANLSKTYPKQIGLHLRTDFRLPRKIFSGADIMLLPSIFEPGGIVALEALRYGVVPLVRRTGGLNDIVVDFDPVSKVGNGFSFLNNDPLDFFATLIEALTIFKQPNLWYKLVHNGMSYDFSWKYSAQLYENLYKNVMESRRRVTSATPHPAYEQWPQR